mmetsp:Transcript_24903/g.45715  ORF Transcript_24903/g.45715 Transcript_24903/m.45715 type:complete len:298 (-) Transcript_24903:280-1173(-)
MGLACCSDATPERCIQTDAAGQEPQVLQTDEGGKAEGPLKGECLPAAASAVPSQGAKEAKARSGEEKRKSKDGAFTDALRKQPKDASPTSGAAEGGPSQLEKKSALDPEMLQKLHFMIRWGKPADELVKRVASCGVKMRDFVRAIDPKTGNQALHIAAQNGHRSLVQCLLQHTADVNGVNSKGNTPLHMSVEYDLYFVSKCLIDAKADPESKNTDNHKALCGIGGDKIGKDAWDNPVAILGDISDNAEEVSFAFDTLEKSSCAMVDKATLVRIGLRKRKECPKHWDRDRFKVLLDKV